MGCMTCKHDWLEARGHRCTKAPADDQTPESVAIVHWLTKPYRDRSSDDGCPSYERVEPRRV